MIIIIVLISIFLIIGVLAFLTQRNEKLRLLERFKNRLSLSDDEFARLFTPDKSDIAVRTRQILKKRTDIDLSRIVPSDELCKHLGLGRVDYLDVIEFIKDIEKEYHIRIPDSEALKMRSISDIVDYITQNRS